MKLIVILSMLVIFISCFFVFFTFDSIIKTKMVCEYTERFACNVSEINMTIVIGVIIVAAFILVDTLVIYIMVNTWVPNLFMYGYKK